MASDCLRGLREERIISNDIEVAPVESLRRGVKEWGQALGNADRALPGLLEGVGASLIEIAAQQDAPMVVGQLVQVIEPAAKAWLPNQVLFDVRDIKRAKFKFSSAQLVSYRAQRLRCGNIADERHDAVLSMKLLDEFAIVQEGSDAGARSQRQQALQRRILSTIGFVQFEPQFELALEEQLVYPSNPRNIGLG